MQSKPVSVIEVMNRLNLRLDAQGKEDCCPQGRWWVHSPTGESGTALLCPETCHCPWNSFPWDGQGLCSGVEEGAFL